MVAIIVIGVLALVVGGILFYRNNQKKIEADASKVAQDAKQVGSAVQGVVDAAKNI